MLLLPIWRSCSWSCGNPIPGRARFREDAAASVVDASSRRGSSSRRRLLLLLVNCKAGPGPTAPGRPIGSSRRIRGPCVDMVWCALGCWVWIELPVGTRK